MAFDWRISGPAVLGCSASREQSDTRRPAIKMVPGSQNLGLGFADDSDRDLQLILMMSLCDKALAAIENHPYHRGSRTTLLR